MSKHYNHKMQSNTALPPLIEVKSKFDAEFRRYSIERGKMKKFDELYQLVQRIHFLEEIPFTISYTDPRDGYLLPINNDDNFAKSLECARPLLRIILQRKGAPGESVWDISGANTMKRTKFLPQLIGSPKVKPPISYPEDFRQVAQIIDVDTVPERCRRVRLLKHGSEKPLGFYIRDGTSLRVTPTGLEKVPGIFISRLVPGGLAESTGLLAVNDEVLEVNGIEVAGKTLDQVTDMMVANSSNLIVTVKPANQRYPLEAERGSSARTSQLSRVSAQSGRSTRSSDSGGAGPEDLSGGLLAGRNDGVLHL
ncbi:Partitioning defective 6 gamma [Amphibalanus amphitrite]|uniref:Partitioning defective 6 gamma n=1 Tax=Amphibalanus amphitrite TaxID=1232801 RepID=A0A6A4X9U9_AMPAM|nr:partitioning defective 6 homolog gamma-like [Amphibalanus amphitrite]XP_043238254.1 partitioning defective 6 homolog gamma-like [Amphibalanus amphitrite]XP_043238255.1 partitioning defective 6 homolog gamma-like [Amphibalanus amphitrite]XP_043238256.1 partitioning defective 6 homolog gamma-like [Amphibalanus amphitrite]XP_043238257.1 partitioning defective 6 homolog gamma-like [Amphibalanus amphitrite]XP_043238258.1 partitioning defective 6 homolog gamma-like [Amphibalanus amphitrite]XP_04